MKVRRDMKIEEVLEMNEEKVLNTLTMLSTNFERLRHPGLRRAMGGRVSVEQAAKVARVPLTEMLYVLNLVLGEDEAELSAELFASDPEDFEYTDPNLPTKPTQIKGLLDTGENVVFVDLMTFHEKRSDPLPAVMKGLDRLKSPRDVLLIRHPFDPIPLREMFARRYELASWAEERNPGEWFVYFYRPAALAGAAAFPPVRHEIYLKTLAAAA
jgi:hypothetical protein